MSSHIPDELRQFVIDRAQNRCEYCGLSQSGQAATFHVDHILPTSAGGKTDTDNLALACVGCSLHKAARIAVQDPLTLDWVPIFHPRQDNWQTHFQWDDVQIIGLTPTGRASLVGGVKGLDSPYSYAVNSGPYEFHYEWQFSINPGVYNGQFGGRQDLEWLRTK
jgi:hypothetical protein